MFYCCFVYVKDSKTDASSMVSIRCKTWNEAHSNVDLPILFPTYHDDRRQFIGCSVLLVAVVCLWTTSTSEADYEAFDGAECYFGHGGAQ